jgi:hypothetical protein
MLSYLAKGIMTRGPSQGPPTPIDIHSRDYITIARKVTRTYITIARKVTRKQLEVNISQLSGSTEYGQLP